MPNAPCAACGGCDVVGMLAAEYSKGGQWWLCMDCGLEWVTEDGRPCPKCRTPMEARCGTPDWPRQPDNYDGQTWAYGCPVCDFGDGRPPTPGMVGEPPLAACAGCHDIQVIAEMIRRTVDHNGIAVDIGWWCRDCDEEFAAMEGTP